MAAAAAAAATENTTRSVIKKEKQRIPIVFSTAKTGDVITHSPMWSRPRPGGELGRQCARSSAPVGRASYLRGPEDTGEDRPPIRFSPGACLCSHWGAGFGAPRVGNQHSTSMRAASSSGDLAPPLACPPHPASLSFPQLHLPSLPRA